MISALEYVEKSVPDVLVDGNAETGKLKLNVNGKLEEFDISHVDSLWKMSFTLKDVFDFIVARTCAPSRTPATSSTRRSTACCQTLDPHSVLLRPELYREMKLTTKGEFGGLGFVIQMKEGNLTVVKVLPKTPAFRAGIKKDDQIAKIGEESTVNMDLNEAVSKLRGPVDSQGHHHRRRARAGTRPQVMTLTRAMITIESRAVEAARPERRLRAAEELPGQHHPRPAAGAAASSTPAGRGQGRPGCKGLVLDLRGNPGGLLEQAIQVSDLFVSQRHHRRHRRPLRQAARGEAGPRRRGRRRLPHRGAGQRRQRLGLGDRRRRAQEPQPRGHHRPPDVRQGHRAGALRLPGRQRAQADHRQVPHAGRRLASRRSASSPTSS